MNSRMDKYEFETPELNSRSSKNADLYQSDEIEEYNKIDLNSNVSVLNDDVKNIDVDKIREMLDKKYRDNIPKRKSINIEMDEEEEPEEKIDTKEYDINEVLAKAKNEQNVDYQKERLMKVRNTNYDILDNIKKESEAEDEDDYYENDTRTKQDIEKELMSLINTITQLESKNKTESKIDDDLLDLKDETATTVLEPALENSFYTGNLAVKNEDLDSGFEDMKDDIKSNSILIDILVFIIIIVIIAVIVFFLNKYLNLGLF